MTNKQNTENREDILFQMLILTVTVQNAISASFVSILLAFAFIPMSFYYTNI